MHMYEFPPRIESIDALTEGPGDDAQDLQGVLQGNEEKVQSP